MNPGPRIQSFWLKDLFRRQKEACLRSQDWEQLRVYTQLFWHEMELSDWEAMSNHLQKPLFLDAQCPQSHRLAGWLQGMLGETRQHEQAGGDVSSKTLQVPFLSNHGSDVNIIMTTINF